MGIQAVKLSQELVFTLIINDERERERKRDKRKEDKRRKEKKREKGGWRREEEQEEGEGRQAGKTATPSNKSQSSSC